MASRTTAIVRILQGIGELDKADRELAIVAFIVVAGLRELEEVVEQEARKMPVFADMFWTTKSSAVSSRTV